MEGTHRRGAVCAQADAHAALLRAGGRPGLLSWRGRGRLRGPGEARHDLLIPLRARSCRYLQGVRVTNAPTVRCVTQQTFGSAMPEDAGSRSGNDCGLHKLSGVHWRDLIEAVEDPMGRALY